MIALQTRFKSCFKRFLFSKGVVGIGEGNSYAISHPLSKKSTCDFHTWKTFEIKKDHTEEVRMIPEKSSIIFNRLMSSEIGHQARFYSAKHEPYSSEHQTDPNGLCYLAPKFKSAKQTRRLLNFAFSRFESCSGFDVHRRFYSFKMDPTITQVSNVNKATKIDKQIDWKGLSRLAFAKIESCHKSKVRVDIPCYTDPSSKFYAFSTLSPAHPTIADTALINASVHYLINYSKGRDVPPTALTDEFLTLKPTHRPYSFAEADFVTSFDDISDVWALNARLGSRDGTEALKGYQTGKVFVNAKGYVQKRKEKRMSLPKMLDSDFQFLKSTSVGALFDSDVLIGEAREDSIENDNTEKLRLNKPTFIDSIPSQICDAHSKPLLSAQRQTFELFLSCQGLVTAAKGYKSFPFFTGMGEHVNSQQLKTMFLQLAHVIADRLSLYSQLKGFWFSGSGATTTENRVMLDLVSCHVQYLHYVELSSPVDIFAFDVELVTGSAYAQTFEETVPGLPCAEWCQIKKDNGGFEYRDLMKANFQANQGGKTCCVATMWFHPSFFAKAIEGKF